MARCIQLSQEKSPLYIPSDYYLQAAAGNYNQRWSPRILTACGLHWAFHAPSTPPPPATRGAEQRSARAGKVTAQHDSTAAGVVTWVRPPSTVPLSWIYRHRVTQGSPTEEKCPPRTQSNVGFELVTAGQKDADSGTRESWWFKCLWGVNLRCWCCQRKHVEMLR